MLRKSYAIRIANLSADLQWDAGRGIWLFAILLAAGCLLALGDSASPALRYEREAIAAGQWWRILTAHAVHADWHHYTLNALGLVLMWALFAREYDAIQWTLIVLFSAACIGLGLWFLEPKVQWYVGASGVLHSLMGAGCVRRVLRREWDRWILSACLLLKIGAEQYARIRGGGALSGTLPVIVDAHLYGALAGILMGAAIGAGEAIIRKTPAIP